MFALELQIKQFVCKVRGALCDFYVFETGNPRYYLFSQLDNYGCQTTLQFPIAKRDLRRDWKKHIIV